MNHPDVQSPVCVCVCVCVCVGGLPKNEQLEEN